MNSFDVVVYLGLAIAVVIGFNTRPDPGAQRAVEASGVDVRLYDVIYKLTDDVGTAMRGLLQPKLVEVVAGHGAAAGDHGTNEVRGIGHCWVDHKIIRPEAEQRG